MKKQKPRRNSSTAPSQKQKGIAKKKSMKVYNRKRLKAARQTWNRFLKIMWYHVGGSSCSKFSCCSQKKKIILKQKKKYFDIFLWNPLLLNCHLLSCTVKKKWESSLLYLLLWKHRTNHNQKGREHESLFCFVAIACNLDIRYSPPIHQHPPNYHREKAT